MSHLNESEEGSEEDEEGGNSQYESETGSGSGSSDEDGEESDGDEDEEEDEPVLKYKRFAKEVVVSINEVSSASTGMPIQICCMAVHSKVGLHVSYG